MSNELICDPELGILLNQNIHALGEQRLGRLIETHKRFDRTVTVRHENDTETEENHWFLKKVLKEVPSYAEAATNARLTPEQTEDLLLHLLNSTPYDFEDNATNISLLRRAIDQETNNGNSLRAGDITKIRKMISLGGKYGVLPASIYGYTTARRIGISVKDSVAMITHLSDADGSLAGYTFGSFNEALSTLAIAKADPELVAKTFALLGGKRPYYRQGAYRMFKEAVTFGCPSMEITPEELMRSFFAYAKAGEDITAFLERVIGEDGEGKALLAPQAVILLPNEEREKHFIHKDGRLEQAALPYQTQLPLEEGIRDLEKLARASNHRWEDVGEGMWVFDEESETWYSLGGKTDIDPGRKVRHNFIKFDIAQLSAHPLLLHIHPEELEIMLRNPYDVFPNRRYRDHATKFLTSTPSRADYP